MLRRRESGDTLIEVLFAVTVLSLVVVMSLAIMNQGTAAAIRSLHITIVRQEVDSQAEALRYLNSAYVSAYNSAYAPTSDDSSPAAQYYRILQDATATSATAFSEGDSTLCAAAPSNGFIVNTRTAAYLRHEASFLADADSYAQVTYNSDDSLKSTNGMWIEAVRTASANGSNYTDFHIRACWPGTGEDNAMRIGTIVRLYDPAS